MSQMLVYIRDYLEMARVNVKQRYLSTLHLVFFLCTQLKVIAGPIFITTNIGKSFSIRSDREKLNLLIRQTYTL